MIRQTWTLDGDTDVVVTNFGIEPNSQKAHRLEFPKPDGVMKSFALQQFFSTRPTRRR
jgi:hypothetical protein